MSSTCASIELSEENIVHVTVEWMDVAQSREGRILASPRGIRMCLDQLQVSGGGEGCMAAPFLRCHPHLYCSREWLWVGSEENRESRERALLSVLVFLIEALAQWLVTPAN